MTGTQKGFSLIELLMVVAIILVIAAIAIPNLVRAKISANEASAVSSLRMITTSQISYKLTHNTYSVDLVTLGPTDAGLITDTTISDAPHQHSGYTFSTLGTPETFEAGATPMGPNTGTRSFCTNTPAAIFFSIGGSCDPATSATL